MLESIWSSCNELEYIKAIADTTEKVNQAVLSKDTKVFENISTFPILEDIRNDVVQNAIISLCKRLCESENIRLESMVQDVKSLHPEDTNLPEAKCLIEIIRLANLNATSVISFIWAEDFTSERTESIFPVQQADSLIEGVSMFVVAYNACFK